MNLQQAQATGLLAFLNSNAVSAVLGNAVMFLGLLIISYSIDGYREQQNQLGQQQSNDLLAIQTETELCRYNDEQLEVISVSIQAGVAEVLTAVSSPDLSTHDLHSLKVARKAALDHFNRALTKLAMFYDPRSSGKDIGKESDLCYEQVIDPAVALINEAINLSKQAGPKEKQVFESKLGERRNALGNATNEYVERITKFDCKDSPRLATLQATLKNIRQVSP